MERKFKQIGSLGGSGRLNERDQEFGSEEISVALLGGHRNGCASRRVDAQMYCEFCRRFITLWWYPGTPTDMAQVLALHFRECPERGDELKANVGVLDGEANTVLTIFFQN